LLFDRLREEAIEPYVEIADISVGDHAPVRLIEIINVSPESLFNTGQLVFLLESRRLLLL